MPMLRPQSRITGSGDAARKKFSVVDVHEDLCIVETVRESL